MIGDGEPSTLNWKLPGDSFDPQFYTSFWWTNQSDGFPLYTQVHSGNFTAQLFSLLFDPAGGAKTRTKRTFILRCLNPEANRYDDKY